MLTPAQLAQFDQDGYLVVPGAVPPELVARLRAAAEALVATLPPKLDRKVWHERVLFRRAAYRQLLDCPLLVHSARQLMGDDVQLLAMDLLAARAGTGHLSWHRDVTFQCNKTLSMNTGIYLQDMTPELGQLRVLPGSHRQEAPLAKPVPDPLPGEVRVAAPAGAAVFFDAALLHTGDRNLSSQDRLAVFPYFGRYWIKRMDNYFTQPLPATLQATSDPLKRQLLGLGLGAGIASYHGDNEGYNRDRGEAGIDFPAPE